MRVGNFRLSNHVSYMKKIIFAAIAAVVLSAGALYGAASTMQAEPMESSAAEKGKPFSFTVSGFDEIELSGMIRVEYTIGTLSKVTVTPGDDVDPDLFRYKLDDGELKMWIDNKNSIVNKTQNGPLFTVTMSGPALKSVEVGGMSSVDFIGNYSIDRVKAEAGGMSNIEFGTLSATKADLEASGMSKIAVKEAKVGILDAEASGMSKIAVSGTADEADLDASGMSKINCGKLKCSRISSHASGMSSIDD